MFRTYVCDLDDHPSAVAAVNESASAKSVADRHAAWKADMPADDQALWDWLATLDDASRLALLAHCTSFGVNALFEKVDRYGGSGVTAHGLAASPRSGGSPGAGRQSRHGGGWLATDGRQLSRPRHQEPDPRSGS